MTNFPYKTKQNGSAHKYKYYCYSEACTVHIFIRENRTGKPFLKLSMVKYNKS